MRYTFAKCIPQEGSVDCGAFAAVDLIMLALHLDPREYFYDQKLLRIHIAACLMTRTLIPMLAKKRGCPDPRPRSPAELRREPKYPVAVTYQIPFLEKSRIFLYMSIKITEYLFSECNKTVTFL